VPLLLLSGCQNSTGTGALVGAGTGAVLGNALAKAGHGSRTAGTAIGAIGGALVGGAVGNGVDRSKEQARADGARDAAAALAPSPQAPTLAQIVDMTNNNVPADAIIRQIQTTGAVYSLSYQDLEYLSNNHVHPAVIREMQATAVRPRVYQQPVTVIERPAPVYVAEPAPVVGIGIGARIR
jgi:hypothetical protein